MESAGSRSSWKKNLNREDLKEKSPPSCIDCNLLQSVSLLSRFDATPFTSGYQCKRQVYKVLVSPFVLFFLFFSVFSTVVKILFWLLILPFSSVTRLCLIFFFNIILLFTVLFHFRICIEGFVVLWLSCQALQPFYTVCKYFFEPL